MKPRNGLITFLTLLAWGSSPAIGEASKPLSPRAAEIRSMKSAARDALDERCQIKANWKSVDCLARIEVENAARAEDRQSLERGRERERKDCVAGKKDACIKLACPRDGAIFFSTAAEVRACSRAQGLPVTDKWAQTSESTDDTYHRFGYVCLQPLRFLDSFGVEVSVFAGAKVRWVVTDKQGPKEYEAEVVKDRTFSSKEAAATADCVAQVPRHREFMKLGGFIPLK
jgi:hypothetical protein